MKKLTAMCLKFCKICRFPSPSVTKAALLRLHQMEVLGSYLVVEYAHDSDSSCRESGTSTHEK